MTTTSFHQTPLRPNSPAPSHPPAGPPDQWERPNFLLAERLMPIAEAAQALGAKYWQVQRAVKRGAIPSYTPFNSRRLVKLSEVVAYIDSCRQGGEQ